MRTLPLVMGRESLASYLGLAPQLFIRRTA